MRFPHPAALTAVLLAIAAVPLRGDPPEAQLFETITDKARERAEADYAPPETLSTGAFADMDYDTYRQIRFRPDSALWHQDPYGFSVQLFHPGFLFNEPVRIYTVDGGEPTPLVFDPALFDYGGEAAGVADAAEVEEGFAGFRIHYPINEPDVRDEVVAFLGASYFRLIGRDHVYGLSSRGLAVDTAGAADEEFPAFRAFWLRRPEADSTRFEFFALLDSPSVTGAYRFELRTQPRVFMDVEKRLFARRTIDNLGVAPLTSMFSHGQPSMTRRDDFRPRVHDSEGLMMETRLGEWLWRPLINPRQVRVTSLQDRDPRGFGLVQRDRRPISYLDLEANYHRRPSQWVAPVGDWGRGGVELVEIPAAGETDDNIVAYWAPEDSFVAGSERVYRYRLTPFGSESYGHEQLRVARTRTGWAAVPGSADPPPREERRFIVDFEHAAPMRNTQDEPPDAHLDASSGSLGRVQVQPLPEDAGWRVAFLLRPDGDAPADMRLHLRRCGEPVSETWNFVWYPDEL